MSVKLSFRSTPCDRSRSTWNCFTTFILLYLYYLYYIYYFIVSKIIYKLLYTLCFCALLNVPDNFILDIAWTNCLYLIDTVFHLTYFHGEVFLLYLLVFFFKTQGMMNTSRWTGRCGSASAFGELDARRGTGRRSRAEKWPVGISRKQNKFLTTNQGANFKQPVSVMLYVLDLQW